MWNLTVISCIYFCRNGVQQRRNSWQDGVFGTNCPIRPGKNFTYVLQVKDQIGSFFYFPSLLFHKAAGGYGGIRVWSRPKIPVPFPTPAGDFTVLAGDWYKRNHYVRILFLHLLWYHISRGVEPWSMFQHLLFLISFLWILTNPSFVS